MKRFANEVASVLVQLFGALIAGGWASAAAAAGEQSGASAFGTADFLYQPCVTFACTPAPGNWSTGNSGGPGSTSASVAWPGGINSDLGYLASAQLTGDVVLPILAAYAAATTQPGTYPGYSSDCCYLNSASVSAKGIQYYTYIGSVPTTYTLTFDVDGTITGGRASIQGGVTLLDGLSGNLESPLGNFIDGALISANQSVQGPFSKSGSVSVALDPGEGFYVSAFLNASVPREGEGFADASHTFTAHFTAGDTSLLTPTLTTAVPEPVTLWSMVAGLIGLGAISRRRLARAAPQHFR